MKNKWQGLISSFFVILIVIFGFMNFSLIKEMKEVQMEIFVAEEYELANIKIDANKLLGYLTPSFAAWAQGGEEMGTNMLAGTENLMKETKPRYIRLDHIFDDDYYGVVGGSSGNLSYDFSKLDGVVDSILAMGAKPFFSLGYMSKIVAETKISQPYNYDDWYQLVRATINHYSGTKGIEDVYYEVWNEPDLESFGSWKYWGDKSYIKLYGVSARAASDVRIAGGIRKFKVGGPGITALYENWIKALVNYCKEADLPLDFLSWHRYSLSPEVFEQDMLDIKKWLSEYDGEYELIISEWGPDSEKSRIYASSLAGAHAVSVMERIVEDLSFGFAFEVKDGPNQEDFGWGALYFDKKIKPRYRAMVMMSDMSGDYLEMEGEGTNVRGWVVKDGDEVRLLLSNYSSSAMEDEDVPIRIEGLKPDEYTIKIESLIGKTEIKEATIGGELANNPFLAGQAEDGIWEDELLVRAGDVVKITLNPKESDVLGIWDYKE